jgi:hypothetical protein
MRMPKAAMHEHHRSILWQNYVRPSREVAPMEPEPVPQGVERPPDPNFGLRVSTFDASHTLASFSQA